jgi:putative alpha-1,2-mannosidase
MNQITLNLENGKQVTLSREGKGCYIQSMTINGKSYSRNYLDHSQLTNGCNIHFVMGESPNTKRGTGKQDAPYSFSK